MLPLRVNIILNLYLSNCKDVNFFFHLQINILQKNLKLFITYAKLAKPIDVVFFTLQKIKF